MAYVIAAPEIMTAAATDVATIGSNVSAAHMIAAAPTVAVVPAAADEVSAGIARVFSQHATSYQAMAGQAAAFNDQFVQNLTAGAFSYASTEAANVSLLGFLSFLQFAITTEVTTLPLPQALLFLLALPIEIPILFLLYAILAGLASLPPISLHLD